MANVMKDLVTWLKGWFYPKGDVDDLLDLKQDLLVDTVNIATINSQSLLNGGDIEVGGGSGGGVYGFGVDSTVADDVLLYIDASSGVSYHLEFLEASYVAIGGVATVSVLVLENYEPIENAEVSFSSDESTTTTATTDANGVATATITFGDSTTLTAEYQSTTATATITVQSYLLYDDASADNTSNTFSNTYINLRNSGSNTVAWNSNGYYIITNTGSQKESMRELLDLQGITDDFVIEYDSYIEQTGGSSGFVIYNSSTAWEKLTDDGDSNKTTWYGYNNGSFHEVKYFANIVTNQKWIHCKYVIQGSTFSIEITYNGDVVWSHSETIHFNRSSSTKYGLDSEWQSNTKTRYKNIIAYQI